MLWSTTFYYEQELRSAYMNNTLKGLIKPGIYNLNATFYTMPYDDLNPNAIGVYLRIKKGSIFVFSNAYESINGVLTRNLNALGNYLVKCVAEEDINIHMAQPNGNYSSIFEEAIVGSGIPKTPVLFVYTRFSYKEDALGSVSPTFHFAVPSSNPYLGSESAYMLPNEDISETNGQISESYLILGALLDNNAMSADYTEGNYWRISGDYNGQTAWINNHVFTGRGFPEYAGQVSRNYGQNLPSMIFAPSYNKTYITPGYFYFNSLIYKIDGPTWKAIYGQGGSPYTGEVNSTSGYLTDHKYASAGATTYTKDTLNLSGISSKLVVEFLFLAIKSEYARAEDTSFASLFSPSGTFTLTRKFLPYRVVCDDMGLDLNSQTALQTFFNLPSYSLIPLDISVANIDRLKSYLYNKNIIPPIVDKLRQNAESASPYLSPTNGESLIPILISFRKVNASGTDFEDKGSLQSYTSMKDSAGNFRTSAVNPVNVLAFFEVQSSSFAILSTSLISQEVFDVIPFLD